MSHKNLAPISFQWQIANPATNFLPNNPSINSGGSAPSGVVNGVLSSTNTIYSQIIEVSRMDTVGLSVNFTGTASGTFSVMVANSDVIFNSLTFSPALSQPSGSNLSYFINISQLGAKYLMLQYTNTSGSGTLVVTGLIKDI